MTRTTQELCRDYGLVLASLGAEVIAFALFLSTMVGPVPNYSSGSSLLHLSNNGANSTGTDVWLGPLGACAKMATGVVACSTASLYPSYTATYDMMGIPKTLQEHLPTENKDLPGILLFVILVVIISLLCSIVISLPRLIPRMERGPIQVYLPLVNRICIVMMGVALAFGITVAGCFQQQMGYAGKDFTNWAETLNSSWAANSRAGIAQSWAGVAMIGVAILGHLGLSLHMPKAQLKLGSFQWA